MPQACFISTSHQHVLAFLASRPDARYYDAEITKATGLSAGAVNQALRDLAKDGYLIQETKGRMKFYSIDIDNPIIRQFKVLLNIVELNPLVEKLKEYSKRIVLFGSAAKGKNTEESDIDLFVMTNEPEEIRNIIFGDELAEKIQLVVKTPTEYASMSEKEPVFYERVMKGMVLWEEKGES